MISKASKIYIIPKEVRLVTCQKAFKAQTRVLHQHIMDYNEETEQNIEYDEWKTRAQENFTEWKKVFLSFAKLSFEDVLFTYAMNIPEAGGHSTMFFGTHLFANSAPAKRKI